MDSNEQIFQAAATTPSEEQGDSSDASRTLTVGSILTFSIMGAFPMIVIVWVIRKAMIKSKHPANQIRRKAQHYKPSRQIHQTILGHSNIHVDDQDTPARSISSCQMCTEEFRSQDTIFNTDQNLNNAPASPATPTSELPRVMDEQTDGDDTITARLHENCTRLQPKHYLKSPILPTTVVSATTTNTLDPHRAIEYRRACRPQRLYLDEIVPSDVELGLYPPSRTKKTKCTTSKNATNDNDDELSHPSQKDPGIIRRYFGTTIHTSKTKHSSDDDRCPNQASISSGSSSSGIFGHYSDDDDSNGYYDATLYEDFRQLGELVDL